MAEIHARSWEIAYKDIIPMEFIKEKNATRQALYQRIITNENTTQYVIQENCKTVGIMRVAPSQDNDVDDSTYELHCIYLHPDYYRKGIGTQAIDFAFGKALDLGKKYMTVWVFAENENAIKFYGKCGFISENKTKLINYGKAMKCLRMKKNL
jgi:GNAT superfamily N-acetyltransferase